MSLAYLLLTRQSGTRLGPNSLESFVSFDEIRLSTAASPAAKLRGARLESCQVRRLGTGSFLEVQVNTNQYERYRNTITEVDARGRRARPVGLPSSRIARPETWSGRSCHQGQERGHLRERYQVLHRARRCFGATSTERDIASRP